MSDYHSFRNWPKETTGKATRKKTFKKRKKPKHRGKKDPTLPYTTGLTLWMDGADISTMYQLSGETNPVTADSDPVGMWVDKSVNAREATQLLDGVFRPTYQTDIQNGRSAVYANGSQWIFWVGQVVAAPTSQTVFLAMLNPVDESSAAVYCDSQTSSDRIALISNTTTASPTHSVYDGISGGATILTNIAKVSPGAVQIMLRRDNTSLEAYLNGVIQDSATIASSSKNSQVMLFVQHGGLSKFTGYILEVLVYEHALATADRESVDAYLADKWGL